MIGSPVKVLDGQSVSSFDIAATANRALIGVHESGILVDIGGTPHIETTEVIAQQTPTQRDITLASNHVDYLSSFTEGDRYSLRSARPSLFATRCSSVSLRSIFSCV